MERKPVSHNFRNNLDNIFRFTCNILLEQEFPLSSVPKIQLVCELLSVHLIAISTVVVALSKQGVALDANYSTICRLLKFGHVYQKLLFL